MRQPMDILDERDPLTLPFIGSLIVHGCVIAVFFMSWFWLKQKPDSLGEPNPSGGLAYAVSPTRSIPIPQKQAPPNPVAHDTESLAPTAPAEKEAEKKRPEPPKDAFQIPDKIKPQKEQPRPQQKYTAPAPPNQVYSQTPQAVSNPMYAAQPGSGQVGIGPNSLLGSRYGFYAQLIRERLSKNWQTNGLNARSQSAPVVVDFHILNGQVIGEPKVVQSSGNPDIDNSARRAVYDSNPLTPFPPQLTGNDILAEFTFNLH
jgi:outer membrane biosynthesis protein TonB